MSTFTRMPRTQLLVLTSVLIVVAELFANLINVGDEVDESGDVGGFIALSVFGVALTALLLLVVVPRIPRQNRRTAVLAFGIAAVVFCLVFWSAIPFALGAAALYAAGPGEEQIPEQGEAQATAGVLLALLAWLAALVLCIIG